MEDAVFALQHQSRVLQELRREISGRWDDNAAHQLNQRYLDPHEADSAEMNAALQSQSVALDNAASHFEQAHEHAIQVENLAFAVDESLRYARRESITAREFQEQHRAALAQAQHLIPRVGDLIAAAEQTCQGVPRQ